MIHLVTDSTSDLLASEAAELGVTVVPLTVRFGEEELKDGVDIQADDFYRRLVAGERSKTSQPSPELFSAVYREKLANPDDVVISVHISSKLSGTMQSALVAASELPEGRVRVVDSETVSGGIQLLVRAARADIDSGCDADTVVANLESRRARTGVFVLLDTLTYLHRGGRIGRASAFLGGILNVKPILHVKDGEVGPETRVRSRQQGVSTLLALVEKQGPLEAVAAFHAAAADLLTQFRDRVAALLPELPVHTGQLGPVVGTYSGPGGLGVAFIRSA